jgi:UDP-N-acetylglucosamine 2-epimerase (non-hydrolysing)
LQPNQYSLLTLHRPSNVDVPETLAGIIGALVSIQEKTPILFPAHPRTVNRMREFGFLDEIERTPAIQIVEPLGYLEFLDLMIHARLVLTDSGGIQEETTILGIPCLTLRDNTERPVTITEGTNLLVGSNPDRITAAVEEVLIGQNKAGHIPELWDGRAAERIVTILREQFAGV